jgi:UDP-N-acetylmuramoyl-L-alanyl-D-glutamate--2,6-diaminopimelate ligase
MVDLSSTPLGKRMARDTSLDQLLKDAALAGTIRIVAGDAVGGHLRGISEDSRIVEAGHLFVARSGFDHDGADHIEDAIGRGAIAILASPEVALRVPSPIIGLAADDPGQAGGELALVWNGRPDRQLDLVGITGTNGKTTVATLVRQILERTLGRTGLLGTVEIHDGRSSKPARLTTPGRVALAGILGDMVDRSCRAAVMEVSSHALDQGRTAGLDFQVGLFTNLSGDHLDYHGSMERYGAAKASLFAGLREEATAIVNLEDEAADLMLRACPANRIGIAAADAECDADSKTAMVRHAVIDRRFDGMTLAITTPEGRTHEIPVPLVGEHNAFNATAAATVAVALGASWEAALEVLPTIEAPRGRLQPVHRSNDDIRVFVDYAHTDDALVNVLAGVRPTVPPGADLIVVFGAGGDRDRSKRPRMMRAALDGADQVVVTSDNPRTENPDTIVTEIVSEVTKADRGRTVCEVDRKAAIASAIASAHSGDVLIIAGKGHEDYQIIGVQRVHFDDVEEAAAALAHRRGEASG